MKKIFLFGMICLGLSSRTWGQEEDQKRKPDEKFITTDMIVFNLDPGDITESTFRSEKDRAKQKTKSEFVNEEMLKEYNESLDNYLTSLLIELNYLDTSERFFPDYKNSLHLDMYVEELHFETVRAKRDYYNQTVYLEMVADLKLYSYYGKERYSARMNKEELIATRYNDSWAPGMEKLLKDILYEFLFSQEVQSKTESNEYFDLYDESMYTPMDLPSMPASKNVEQWRECVATVISEDSHGSACVISQDGYLLTNFHVVGQNDTVRVKFQDNTNALARVLRRHPDCDLALIKVERSGLEFLTPAQNQAELGAVVYVVGTPADTLLAQSVSRGVISGRRDYDGSSYLQTDAKVNGGNSGGALINEKGELVGIVSAKYMGYGIEGIGFAVPIEKLSDDLHVQVKAAKASPPPPPPAPPAKKKKK